MDAFVYIREFEKEQRDWIIRQIIEQKNEIERLQSTTIPAIDRRINHISEDISLKNEKNVSEFASIHKHINLIMVWK